MMPGFYTGKPVTVIAFTLRGRSFVVHRVRVQMRPNGRRRPHMPFALGRRLKAAQEGVSWTRGHEGEDVEALITAAALR